MPMQTLQKLIWNTILLLKQSNLITEMEAARICLVRFTWNQEQASARLAELEERYLTRK